ncbi:hypothetical protein KTN05_06460 [Paracoccus sp. Z118]|uniref:hypothetical protein n=1 Tax=Paracoccus sp. Z118 TaxID=2851017 RepID=UPI001C2BF57A|nr:hypothetical protein [Paracoccus sp. Z118]MBV0891497.1 hypothetical protein [Paracoccus sp. Z118]
MRRFPPERLVTSDRVIAVLPEVIPSCGGKKVRRERIAARPGWGASPSMRNGHTIGIKPPLTLQPAPAALASLDTTCQATA